MRTSGTAASLCGIGAAVASGDDRALALAIDRLVVACSIVVSFGGIPLLYMGDEVALVNDTSHLLDPTRRADNRWLHRPRRDAAAMARRHDPSTLEGRVFAWTQRLVDARGHLGALHGAAAAVPWWSGNDHVLAYRRQHPRSGPFLALVNAAEQAEAVALDLLGHAGIEPDDLVLCSGPEPVVSRGSITLPAMSFAWFAASARGT